MTRTATPVSSIGAPPDWSAIDTVLLDLDGTLLDLAYDNYIWMARLPELFAEAQGLSIEEAQAILRPQFLAWRGSMQWYSIEFWTEKTGIDLAALHREEAARVAWLPGAREFLQQLRGRGLRAVLMTDSHPLILDIKHERTGVLDLLDAAYSSHRFGVPKQNPAFWPAARAVEPFDPQRTVFVDDSPAVVRAAMNAGIRWVYAVRHADSSRAPENHEAFAAIDRVADLLTRAA